MIRTLKSFVLDTISCINHRESMRISDRVIARFDKFFIFK